ncbi:MAG: AAA family ATPase [Gammaproteobacteria bacterium]
MSDAPPLEAAAPEDAEAAAREREAQAIRGLAAAYLRLRDEIGKVIVGQRDVVDQLLIALFSGGHSLLIGVPGLAKTLLVNTISRILSLTFRRIQFTPDLMPSDITGTDILRDDPETGQRSFQFMQGPIFTNILLADEINRTPPKTQAALLEAMQERQVTVGGKRHALPQPFFVLATQNPIEQEGTYPLPEAQLDRFMFQVKVDYPTEDEEFQIVRSTTGGKLGGVERLLGYEEVLQLQDIVRRVPVADHVIRYALQLTRLTRRNTGPNVPTFINDFVNWGAGPRASQCLILGAKARAVLHGQTHATLDDVQAVSAPVLRHRLVLNFHAEAEGLTTDELVRRLLELVPADPSGGGEKNGIVPWKRA